MIKALVTLMFIVVLIGCAIILMLAQVIAQFDGGGLFSNIPIIVYLIIVVAICLCAWALPFDEKK